MRLHYGPTPESPEFQPEATGWRPLREPSVGALVWLASGVGLVAGALAIVVWTATASNTEVVTVTVKLDGPWAAVAGLLAISAFLGGVLLLIVVHELLHAAVFPGWWPSPKTILGVWPSMGVFYAHYDGPLSRNRFLLVLMMPFLVLTVGLWLFDLMVPTGWGGVLAAISILNAMFAGGDLLGTAMIAAQVPANAQVRNQGWKTWWRVPTVDVEERVKGTVAASIPIEAVQET
jgi:hypothetical protein